MNEDELGLIGKSLEEVEKILTESNIRYRLARINGKAQIVTRDYRPDRINLEIKQDIVVEYSKG